MDFVLERMHKENADDPSERYVLNERGQSVSMICYDPVEEVIAAISSVIHRCLLIGCSIEARNIYCLFSPFPFSLSLSSACDSSAYIFRTHL